MLFHRSTQHRRLMAVAVTVFAASVASAGCGTTSASRTGSPVSRRPAVIVVRDHANGKTVSASPGDRIELILSSNYWHVSGASAPRVLRQDGPSVLLPRPRSCPGIPGLGCTPVRTEFTALTHGKTEIRASRSACGEALACRPDQTRFTVTIVVQ